MKREDEGVEIRLEAVVAREKRYWWARLMKVMLIVGEILWGQYGVRLEG